MDIAKNTLDRSLAISDTMWSAVKVEEEQLEYGFPPEIDHGSSRPLLEYAPSSEQFVADMLSGTPVDLSLYTLPISIPSMQIPVAASSSLGHTAEHQTERERVLDHPLGMHLPSVKGTWSCPPSSSVDQTGATPASAPVGQNSRHLKEEGPKLPKRPSTSGIAKRKFINTHKRPYTHSALRHTVESQRGHTIKLPRPQFAAGNEAGGSFMFLNFRKKGAWSRGALKG